MYTDALWDLVERAYSHLEREFPGREVAKTEVMVRFENPVIGWDTLDVIFKDCLVRFKGGKHPITLPVEPTRDIIVAIDDEPIRYAGLAREAARRGWVIIPVDRPAMIEWALQQYGNRILAVLLDHDIPGYSGKQAAKDYLINERFPVIITTNNPPRAVELAALLDEYGVPNRRHSAMGMLRKDIWMSTLKEWSEQGS